jgi:hypothetical protein
MYRSRFARLFVCLFSVLALLLIARPANSQEVTAAINGTVTDPSGAAVAGVKVTAKDLDRGTTFPTTTGSDGHFNLPRVPIGNYEVRAEDPGFQVAVISPVVLVLNQVAKIDFPTYRWQRKSNH